MSLGAVALIFVLLSVYTDWLTPLRAKLSIVATPFYWITDAPGRVVDWGSETVKARQQLKRENAAMKNELLVSKRKLQQMGSLAAENVRLRHLLNSAESVTDRVLVAELIGVSPDPLTHRVIINKGSHHGVYLGQPLLDAYGLMGQVVELGVYTSQVLLITDVNHALPVQVNRNGVRAVAEGQGNLHELKLRHLSNTVDIRVGDVLVSSGLGQRFPVGYPVAEIVSVLHDPGLPFARVVAKPKAQLNRSRHVLLVFSVGRENSDAGAKNSTVLEE